MVLSILKGKHPLILILVPLVALLLFGKALIDPQPLLVHSYHMPLYALLVELCGGSQMWLNLVAFVFVVVVAYVLVRLNEEFIFIKQRTDLPALLFVLIVCGTIPLLGMHPAIPAGLFLVVALERIFGVYTGSKTISCSFDAGLCIGVASLFYLGAAPFLLWFLISLIIMGYFRARELMSGLMGFITPFILVAGWYFWNDKLPWFGKLLWNNISLPGVVQSLPTAQWVHWGFVGVLALVSIFFMLNVYEEKRSSSRKYFAIIIWFMVFSVLIYFLIPAFGIEQYLLAAIPLTYITSHFFVLYRSRWIGEVLFVLLIFMSVIIHFFV